MDKSDDGQREEGQDWMKGGKGGLGNGISVIVLTIAIWEKKIPAYPSVPKPHFPVHAP